MNIRKEIKRLDKCIEFIDFNDSTLKIYDDILELLYINSWYNIVDNCKHKYNKKQDCTICGCHKVKHFIFYYDKKIIIKSMKRLMKCMNYVIKKAENAVLYEESEIYYNIYQILGSHAWSDLANHCNHEYIVTKKYPTGRCEYCGTINKDKK